VDYSTLHGSDWIPYAGRACYYSPSGSCADDSGEGRMAVGHVHGTNASSRLNEYYTQESALMVTKIYSTDFEILEYPIWDGVALFK
jgi:hypothetical protein